MLYGKTGIVQSFL